LSLQVHQIEAVTTVLLDRPKKAHAYNRTLLEALDHCLQSLDCRVLVLGSTGQGAFCGGADLEEMKDARPEDARVLYSQAVFNRLAQLPIVSIAAVQGAAIAGGFELALACDIRVAGPHARFSLPEVSLGLIPSAGGSTRLPELVGKARAREVILGGRSLDAELALKWGLIASIAEDPLSAAQEWARKIAGFDASAIAMAKKVLNGSPEDRLELERLAQTVLYARKGAEKP
jgi:enoyl-CoA hydratase/carnithine racemase